MNIRKRILPAGWYPKSYEETRRILDEWDRDLEESRSSGIAGIVPHAGWMFSGRTALSVLRELSPEISTCVVCGGHLPPGDTLLVYPEDAFETPIGNLSADVSVRNAIIERFAAQPDSKPDNTVEVQLPLVKYTAPEIRVVGVRIAPGRRAVELGRYLHDLTKSGHSIAVIGSTDLTHYGPAYGFTPKGTGSDAYEWVRNENDAKFVDALCALDAQAALEHGTRNKAACSTGAAVCALSFSEAAGVRRGKLIDYRTSKDVHPSDSFVGYAGVLYENPSNDAVT